jgi:hypothetical protein
MSDVKPGDGKYTYITGKTYEQVWAASIKVANEHFAIREQNSATGTITAERTMTSPTWGAGAWIGIYITPPQPGADTYRVEVAAKKKLVTDLSEQSWESKTLRDIADVINGQPMR